MVHQKEKEGGSAEGGIESLGIWSYAVFGNGGSRGLSGDCARGSQDLNIGKSGSSELKLRFFILGGGALTSRAIEKCEVA